MPNQTYTTVHKLTDLLYTEISSIRPNWPAWLATTRNPQKEKALRINGATHVLIDNETLHEAVRTIYPEGIDKVLELVGTSTLYDSLTCLKPGGTGCMSGMLAENWTIPAFAPMEFIPATVRRLPTIAVR